MLILSNLTKGGYGKVQLTKEWDRGYIGGKEAGETFVFPRYAPTRCHTGGKFAKSEEKGGNNSA